MGREPIPSRRPAARHAALRARLRRPSAAAAVPIPRRWPPRHRQQRQRTLVAVGRKAWLFVGSDDHAEAAASIFSLVGSCKLHRLDPEAYLRDVLRVVAQWPRDRFLELAPKNWAATRARLIEAELAMPVGPLTIPPPPEEQATAS